MGTKIEFSNKRTSVEGVTLGFSPSGRTPADFSTKTATLRTLHASAKNGDTETFLACYTKKHHTEAGLSLGGPEIPALMREIAAMSEAELLVELNKIKLKHENGGWRIA